MHLTFVKKKIYGDDLEANVLIMEMRLIFRCRITHYGNRLCATFYNYPPRPPRSPDTGRKLNVHKTFRKRPVLCTFNLRPVSRGTQHAFSGDDNVTCSILLEAVLCETLRLLIKGHVQSNIKDTGTSTGRGVVIQDSIKHLQRSFLRMKMTAKSRQLFLQKRSIIEKR